MAKRNEAHELTREIRNWDLPWFLQNPDPQIYRDGSWVVFDLETHNLDYGSATNPNNRVVCAAWCTSEEPDKVHFRWADEFHLQDLMDAIAEADFVVGHNAKFDLQWLKRGGMDIGNVLVYDTMLAEKVKLGNNPRNLPLELGAVSSRYGYPGKEKIVATLMDNGVSPQDMPRYLLRKRVTRDVWTTAKVFRRQVDSLSDKLLAVTYTRCLMVPVLADMEMNGLKLNRERVMEEYDKARAEYLLKQREFEEFTGGINFRSTKQRAKFIYEVLKFPMLNRIGKPASKKEIQNGKVKPKTDVRTLAKLEKYATTQKQKAFTRLLKELSKANAALTKTLAFFKKVVEERDGRFYGQFLQHVTQTHRLSSRGMKIEFLDEKGKPKAMSVQFQNFPRIYKDLLEPSVPGWVMSEADGSQLEFRVAAYSGNDAQAKADIRNDVDVHLFTASILFDVAQSEVTKDQRQEAKEHTFKPLYGGQSGTDAQIRYYEAFREKYWELAEAQRSWAETVLLTKKLEIASGLIFYWPHTRMSETGWIDNTPNIYNYPIQSLATADIIPIAIVHMWHRIRANAAMIRLVNTVHDSVVAEHPPEETELFRALAIQTFTFDVYEYLDQVYHIDFDVPLGVGIKTGSRWSSPDAEEIELNVERDGEWWHKGKRKETLNGA